MPLTILSEPQIDADILKELKTSIDEQGQVVLHFLYKAPLTQLMNIRIWPTSYLYDLHSSHISELIHFENIVLAPDWTTCFPGENVYFTLIFSGLPKSCTAFDFIEKCENEFGNFEARNIERNASDVYYLEIF
jgi:hypothetical protein